MKVCLLLLEVSLLHASQQIELGSIRMETNKCAHTYISTCFRIYLCMMWGVHRYNLRLISSTGFVLTVFFCLFVTSFSNSQKLALIIKNQLTISVWICFWILCSVPPIFVSVYSPIPQSWFIVSLLSGCMTPNVIKIVCLSSSFAFPYKY